MNKVIAMGSKNTKKTKKKKSSGIDREKLGKKKKWFLPVLMTVLIVIPSLIVAFNLGQNLKEREEAVEKKERLIKELIYWQNVVNTHKGYRDAYFRIALLEYQLNDKEKARVYLEKTLKLDPNFEAAKKLEKLL